MTRNEYILELTKALSAMPYSEVNEIKKDIEAHFDEASAAGKSEEETAAALGDINDLAEEFLAGTSFKDAVRKLSKAEKIKKQQEKSAEYIKEHKYAEVSKVETSFMNNNSLSIDQKLIFGQNNASGVVKPVYSNSQNE